MTRPVRTRLVLAVVVALATLAAPLTPTPTSTASAVAAGPTRPASTITMFWGDQSVYVDGVATAQGIVSPHRNLPNRVVSLQVASRGTWRTISTQRAGREGKFAFGIPTSYPGAFTFRVSVAGTKKARARSSSPATYAISRYKSRLSASFPGSSTTWRKNRTITGSVSPVGAGRAVYLQRRIPGGGYATMSRTTVTAGNGRYALKIPASYLGSWKVRVALAETRRESSAVRLKSGTYTVGPAYTPAGYASDHRFLHKPVSRWNPCAGPIRYRINTRHAPRGAVNDIKTALARMTMATGLPFSYRGRTNVVPQYTSKPSYGRGTDLVFAWATPQQSTILKPSDRKTVVARGGAYTYMRGYSDLAGNRVGYSNLGFVVFNRYFTDKVKGGSGPGATRVALVMHEVGHVVGLDHAKRTTQIMYKNLTRNRDVWGRGDLSGLRRVGFSQSCIVPAGSARTAAPQRELVVSDDHGLVTP